MVKRLSRKNNTTFIYSSLVVTYMLIYAHRGLATEFPENTFRAFQKALGYTSNLELDVRLSRDEEVVVIHDEKVNETTDGGGYVSNQTTLQLRRMHTRRREDGRLYRDAIPTLKEVIGGLPGDTRYQIELKEEGVIAPTMKILREAMVLPTKYFFSSFHPEILGRAQQCAPNIGRLMLIDPRLTSGEKTRLVEHLKGKGLEFQGVGLGDYVPEHPDWIDESKRITPRL